MVLSFLSLSFVFYLLDLFWSYLCLCLILRFLCESLPYKYIVLWLSCFAWSVVCWPPFLVCRYFLPCLISCLAVNWLMCMSLPCRLFRLPLHCLPVDRKTKQDKPILHTAQKKSTRRQKIQAKHLGLFCSCSCLLVLLLLLPQIEFVISSFPPLAIIILIVTNNRKHYWY
jgi:hypothetical protein